MAAMFGDIRVQAELLLRMARICRLPGGTRALLEAIESVEAGLRESGPLARCRQCGCTELEPMLGEGGAQKRVEAFRCKACGAKVPAT